MERGSRLSRLLLVVGLCLSGSTTLAAACPFCPPSLPTFAEQLAESDLAVLATWKRIIPAADKPDDSGTEAQTEFQVIDVIRAHEGQPKRDDRITVNFARDGQPGDLVILTAKIVEGIRDWGLPIEVDETSYAYFRKTPSPERPANERLPFFLKYLNHSDPQISNDAFAEFSKVKYEDVVGIQKLLNRVEIRNWLESPKTPQLRLGFYGMLLGLCGNTDDAAFLERQVMAATAPDETRIGLDGLMAGYLLLTGEAGLEKLVARKVDGRDQPDGDLFALINAIRFLRDFATNSVSAKQLVKAMRRMLERPAFAEVAVVDLARWKDWESLDPILGAYGRPPFDDASAKAKIIQFALACQKDALKNPGKLDSESRRVETFLKRLRDEDPDTLRTAERLFRFPAATDRVE